MPLIDEPDIRPLYRDLRNESKELYLPYVTSPEEMHFLPYQGEEHLSDYSPFACKELALDTTRAVVPELLLVPALHYYEGYRLGRGGGYYDRYIERYKPRHLVGLSFGLLDNTAFTIEPWDKPMDYVFTPR